MAQVEEVVGVGQGHSVVVAGINGGRTAETMMRKGVMRWCTTLYAKSAAR